MMKVKGKTYKCTVCGWVHHELDTVGTLGNMINGFSDPATLEQILKQQSAERVAAAMAEHEKKCPKSIQPTVLQ